MKLDILHYVQQLKIRANDQSDQVWDGIRKQWVAFTPEEMVRQLFIQYLIHEKKISPASIAVEKQIRLDKKSKRCDIIIYNQEVLPHILIECKAPTVELTDDTISQVVRYQHGLKAMYVCIVNGGEYRVYEQRDDLKWVERPDID
jgi:hypothetical protein